MSQQVISLISRAWCAVAGNVSISQQLSGWLDIMICTIRFCSRLVKTNQMQHSLEIVTETTGLFYQQLESDGDDLKEHRIET